MLYSYVFGVVRLSTPYMVIELCISMCQTCYTNTKVPHDLVKFFH